MADNRDLGINVSAIVDDALAALNNLIGTITGIPDKTVDVNVEADETGVSNLENDLNNLGSAGSTAGSEISEGLTGADESVNTLGTDAGTAGDQLTQTGDEGAVAGEAITDSFNEATIAIGLMTAGAAEAQDQMYNQNIQMGDLARYTGMTDDATKKMISSMAGAKFPVSDAEEYVTALMQLGVPTNLLEQNAKALNEIQLGTGSSADTALKFSRVYKQMGGDVNDMASSYSIAAYEQKNFVGGLENFDATAPRLVNLIKAMGFNTEETAVIMADLSQKNAGNMRAMMKDISGAKGSGDALLSTLGTTKDAVDSDANSMGNYGVILQNTAEHTRNNVSATDNLKYSWDQFVISMGSVGAALWNVVIIAGTAAAAFGTLKLIDKILPWDSDLAGRYASLWRGLFSNIKDIGVKGINEWKAWGDSADEYVSYLGRNIGKVDEIYPPESFITKLTSFGSRVQEAFGKIFNLGEKGEVNTGFIDDMISQISTKLPTLTTIGRLIPEALSIGVKLGADTLFIGVGEVQKGMDFLMHIDKYYKQGTGTTLLQFLSLDFLKGIPLIQGPVNIIEDLLNRIIPKPSDVARAFGIGDQLGAFYTKIATTARDSFKDMPSLVNLITQPFIDLWNFLSAYDLPGKLLGYGSAMWTGFSNGLNSVLPGVGAAVGNMEAQVMGGLNWLGTLPGQFYSWGGNLWTSFVTGIQSAITSTVGWFQKSVENFFAPLKSLSPPKEGPLVDIEKWGYNLSGTYIDSVIKGLLDGTTKLNMSIKGLGTAYNSGGIPSSSFAGNLGGASFSGNTSSGGINVTVHMNGTTISNSMDAQQVGQLMGSEAAKSLASRLNVQATNAGISTVNFRR